MKPVEWEFLDPRMTESHLGFLAYWLYEDNPKSAVEQINDNYQHGGGWNDFPGFKMGKEQQLSYSGDPDMEPLAKARLRDETIYFYPYSWVAVVQPDGAFRVARID